MSKERERLLALCFGLVCAAVVGGIGWCWLRGSMQADPDATRRGPPAQLTGRVHVGERGIKGAVVYVESPRNGWVHQPGIVGGFYLVELRQPSSEQVQFMVRTDAEGRFDVRLDPSGDKTLYALLPGGGEPAPVHLELTPGARNEADVTVDGPRLTGRVVDAVTGRGLPKSELWLRSWEWPSPVISDDDGRFVVACPPPGNQTLCVRCAGHVARQFGPVPVDPAHDQADVLVELDPESVIEGSVLDSAGNPLLDPRWVIAFHDDHSPQPSGADMLTATSSGGRFRIAGVDSGHQRIGMVVPVEGDLSWKLEGFLSSIHFDQLLDVGVGQTVEVSLQESVPVSPAPPANH